MPLQVKAHARDERVVTDVVDELTQHRRTLGVGDAVEVLQRRVGVGRGRARDGVRRRRPLRRVTPCLAAGGDVDPRVVELGGRDERAVGHVLGERLVEPQVVPPLHRHEVAEPHVRHLVADRVGARQVLGAARGAGEDELVAERHAPRVLHRARVELGNEHLVVLAERVSDAEQLVVVVERLARHGEHLVGLRLEPVAQRGARVQREGNAVVLSRDGGEGAGADGDEIRRERFRRRSAPELRLDLAHGAVGDDRPPLRGAHGDVVRRLEVGLVEAGVDARCRVHEQVAVDVVVAVGGVGGPVQALPVAPVRHARGDDEFVALGEIVEAQATTVEGRGDVEVTPVERR